MLSHIQKDDSILDKVPVLVDTTNLEIVETLEYFPDYQASSFIYTLTNPVTRVSKIDISKVVVPSTFYNVHKENLNLSMRVLGLGFVVTKTWTIDDGTYTSSSIVVEINSKISADPIFVGTTVTCEWNAIKKNKISFKIVKTGYTKLDGVIFASSLLHKLGFNSNGNGILTIISYSSLNFTNGLLTIDGTNDTLIFRKIDDGSLVTLTFPHAVYNIYNIVFNLQKKIKNAGLVSGESTFVEYLSEYDKLLIRFDQTDNYIYNTEPTQLATDLKIDNIRSEVYILADKEINYTLSSSETSLNLYDYTALQLYNGSAFPSIHKINIPEGRYPDIETLVTQINTTWAASSPPFPITTVYDPVRLKVNISFPGATLTIGISSSGLATKLGLNVRTLGMVISGSNLELNYTPKLFTKQIYINSTEITRLRKAITVSSSNVFNESIFSLPVNTEGKLVYLSGDMPEIFLSRKEDIKTFDIYFTDDQGDLLNFNGGDLLILFLFNKS